MTARSQTASPRATSTAAWKKSAKVETRALEVPSGNVALVKNPGMKAFMKAGMIPNSLLPLVTEALERGGSLSSGVLMKKLEDAGGTALDDIFKLVDLVVCECVVQPKVTFSRFVEGDELPDKCRVDQVIPDEHRDEAKLYVDEVEMDDKMFIFQWVVGGTHDVAQFRKQYDDSLADVQRSQDVGS